MTLDRRKEEIKLLRKRYGELEHGPNLDWVLFKAFPLPPRWNREHTELLTLIPAGYPTTPPENFYVRDGLRLANGNSPGNYSEGQSVLGSRWAQFSHHPKVWEPAPAPRDGDNLVTFMLMVEQRLQEGG
jgi:hypothetical protein